MLVTVTDSHSRLGKFGDDVRTPEGLLVAVDSEDFILSNSASFISLVAVISLLLEELAHSKEQQHTRKFFQKSRRAWIRSSCKIIYTR